MSELVVTDKRGRTGPIDRRGENTPPPWWPALCAVDRERHAQLKKWGVQYDRPDGIGHREFENWAAEYKRQNDARQTAGKPGIWSKVLLKEVFEALSAEDLIDLEDELIQVAAVAVAWVEDLQQRRQKK